MKTQIKLVGSNRNVIKFDISTNLIQKEKIYINRIQDIIDILIGRKLDLDGLQIVEEIEREEDMDIKILTSDGCGRDVILNDGDKLTVTCDEED